MKRRDLLIGSAAMGGALALSPTILAAARDSEITPTTLTDTFTYWVPISYAIETAQLPAYREDQIYSVLFDRAPLGVTWARNYNRFHVRRRDGEVLSMPISVPIAVEYMMYSEVGDEFLISYQKESRWQIPSGQPVGDGAIIKGANGLYATHPYLDRYVRRLVAA